MEKEFNYLKELNILRGLMILAVVLGHCTLAFTDGWVLNTNINSNFCRYISAYVNSFHVHILVFISGAVYYFCKIENRRYKTFIELFNNKFKRLVIPYIVIGSFYMIPTWRILNLKKGSYIDNILILILGKDFGYVWFLIMLFNIFIIFYFIEKFILSKSIFFNILLFMTISFFSGYLTSVFKMNRAASYLLYFYIGYLSYQYINKINFTIKNIYKWRYIIVMIDTILICYLINFPNKIPHIKIITTLIKFNIPIIIVMLALVKFYIISIEICKFNDKNDVAIINILHKYNFSIYLLHEPIIMIILSYIVKNNKNINLTLLISICFFASIVLSIIMNKLYMNLKNKINISIKKESLK